VRLKRGKRARVEERGDLTSETWKVRLSGSTRRWDMTSSARERGGIGCDAYESKASKVTCGQKYMSVLETKFDPKGGPANERSREKRHSV